MRVWAGLTLLMLLMIAACSGDDARVTGVVTAVQGGLAGIEWFEVRPSGKDPIVFEPEDGLDVFGDGTTPLTHIFEHLQTGEPVRVTYRVEAGVNVAVVVEDA